MTTVVGTARVERVREDGVLAKVIRGIPEINGMDFVFSARSFMQLGEKNGVPAIGHLRSTDDLPQSGTQLMVRVNITEHRPTPEVYAWCVDAFQPGRTPRRRHQRRHSYA